jgi:deazaflavin-dependent oxidoreductase (nitroreductase family)
MPLPRSLARFNRVVTNRVFAPLAGRVPPWIVLEHVGRRSGRSYRTVLMGFPRRGDMIVALTYGPETDWLRNALAAGHCRVKWLGRWRDYRPELCEGEAALRPLPLPIRVLLSAAGMRYAAYLHRT